MINKIIISIIIPVIVLVNYSQTAFASANIYKLNYGTDLTLSGIGITTLTGAYFLGKHQDTLSEKDVQSLSRSDVNSFDRSATYNRSEKSNEWSNYTNAALIASPVILLENQQLRSDFLTISVMYIESILLESGLKSVVKSTVSRNRPYVYNPDVPDGKKIKKDAVRSFYSGHTSSAFNSAVFLSVVFSDYFPESAFRFAVWGGSLLLASATGYLRYRAGKHYPTDILAGAAMGSLTGYIVPALHRTKDRSWSIVPFTNFSYSGITCSYIF
jgi:membrane-associated phospholipid phosphatase